MASRAKDIIQPYAITKRSLRTCFVAFDEFFFQLRRQIRKSVVPVEDDISLCNYDIG